MNKKIKNLAIFAIGLILGSLLLVEGSFFFPSNREPRIATGYSIEKASKEFYPPLEVEIIRNLTEIIDKKSLRIIYESLDKNAVHIGTFKQESGYLSIFEISPSKSDTPDIAYILWFKSKDGIKILRKDRALVRKIYESRDKEILNTLKTDNTTIIVGKETGSTVYHIEIPIFKIAQTSGNTRAEDPRSTYEKGEYYIVTAFTEHYWYDKISDKKYAWVGAKGEFHVIYGNKVFMVKDLSYAGESGSLVSMCSFDSQKEGEGTFDATVKADAHFLEVISPLIYCIHDYGHPRVVVDAWLDVDHPGAQSDGIGVCKC